jgi:hypothetical protein
MPKGKQSTEKISDGATVTGSAAALMDWLSNSSPTLQSQEKWEALILHYSKDVTQVPQLCSDIATSRNELAAMNKRKDFATLRVTTQESTKRRRGKTRRESTEIRTDQSEAITKMPSARQQNWGFMEVP